MSGEYWKLPLNKNELVESVKWASNNDLSLKIEAPSSVTMELYLKEDKSALILHLVNFDANGPIVRNIKIDMFIPEEKKVTQITVMSPDTSSDEVVTFNENGQWITFLIPQLEIYNLVAVKLK